MSPDERRLRRPRGRKTNRELGMPPRHGTRSEYQLGCRCGPCRAANAAYMRELRRRRSSTLHVP